MDVTMLATEITAEVAAIIKDKFSPFSAKLDTIAAKLDSDAQRLAEAENHISDVEDNITRLQNRMLTMKNKFAVTLAWKDDREARSHKDNVQIFGVNEGTNPLALFKIWLPKFLNLKTTKGKIQLDRSLRSLGRPRPGVPRAVIIKLHYPSVKRKILASNGKQRLEYEGNKIIVRTFHKILSKKKFQLCQELIAKNVLCQMQCPATLRFSLNKEELSFDTAEAVPKVLQKTDKAPCVGCVLVSKVSGPVNTLSQVKFTMFIYKQ